MVKKFGDVFESYEERVASAAEKVRSYAMWNRDRGRRSDHHELAAHASEGSLEARLGGAAHRDFIRDVKKASAKHVGNANRSLSARSRADALKDFHGFLSHEISHAIGHAIPDGDPFDHLEHHASRLADKAGYHGYDHYDLGDHLDKAAKLNGYDSYHHQLRAAWDDYGSMAGDWQHHMTYHKDDPDDRLKHEQLAKALEGEGRETIVTKNGGQINVASRKKFENPW